MKSNMHRPARLQRCLTREAFQGRVAQTLHGDTAKHPHRTQDLVTDAGVIVACPTRAINACITHMYGFTPVYMYWYGFYPVCICMASTLNVVLKEGLFPVSFIFSLLSQYCVMSVDPSWSFCSIVASLLSCVIYVFVWFFSRMINDYVCCFYMDSIHIQEVLLLVVSSLVPWSRHYLPKMARLFSHFRSKIYKMQFSCD